MNDERKRQLPNWMEEIGEFFEHLIHRGNKKHDPYGAPEEPQHPSPIRHHHQKHHHKHHPNRKQHPHTPEADLSKFWVITVLSNPVRYKRRYELYWRFKEMCEAAGVKLITVEQAFGHRPFMVTRPDDPYNVQVRTVEELWHKENMINIGVRHACAIAPGEVREIAWVDADCRSARVPRDWFEETWHQLQHYEFVQMWEYLIDLDPQYNAIGGPQPGFMANYIKYGTPNPEDFHRIQEEAKRRKHGHGHGHHKEYGNPATIFGRPGLAWAANLDAFDKVGGLIEASILGAGDWYMAHGLVGSMSKIVSAKLGSQAYADKLLDWQTKAERWIKRDVGYVPGVVYHDFHGKKINRGYQTRGQILRKNEYNPYTDIKYDSQGLIQLETHDPRQMRLRDEIRAYFRSRNEDSIDL